MERQHVSSYYTKGNVKEKIVNYRVISILNMNRKIYVKALINSEMENMKEHVAEEQGGFRSGWGCEDQIFVLK